MDGSVMKPALAKAIPERPTERKCAPICAAPAKAAGSETRWPDWLAGGFSDRRPQKKGGEQWLSLYGVNTPQTRNAGLYVRARTKNESCVKRGGFVTSEDWGYRAATTPAHFL